MGYDKSLFESQPVNENFQCPICTKVLQDPHTTNPCDHTFCLACIQQCYQNNNCAVCPVCLVSINSSDIKPTMLAFRNILGRLRIRCKFELCSVVVELQHFKQHLRDCYQNPVNQRRLCPKQCGVNIGDNNDEHNCVAFLQNKILTLVNNNSKQEEEIKKLTNDSEKLRQINRQMKVGLLEFLDKCEDFGRKQQSVIKNFKK